MISTEGVNGMSSKLRNPLKMQEKGPWISLSRAPRLVAGAGFEVDSYKAPVLTVRWLYAGARQGSKDMQRVGLAQYKATPDP